MEIIKLENNNGELTANSLEIARVTGKEHNKVLRDIRDELSEAKFGHGSYIDKQNQVRPMYIVSEKGTLQLMSRYSKEVREMVIEEFYRMKEFIKSNQLTELTLAEMTLKVIEGQKEEIKKLESRNEQLTDNLLAYQKYGKSVLVRDFVKTIYDNDKITISEKEMWKILYSKYIMKNKLPYARYKQYFEIVSVVKNGSLRKTTKISPKGILYFTNIVLNLKECE